MRKGVKVGGVIVVLIFVGSVFSGIVSAENVSEDLTKSVTEAESFDKNTFIWDSYSSLAESSSSITIRVKRSTYGSGEIVTLDLESEYLPVVVACENGAAPYESMKAQAVAARTFAMYKKIHPYSNFDVYDDTRDQVYNPTVTVTNQHRQSVTDTNGIVLEYTGDYHTIICAFYVSGTGSTAQYVTYNEGKSGNAITQTTLGYTTSPPSKFPDNRGCMGQVQANNLASSNSYNYQQILRYFYGSDIQGLGYNPQAAVNYANTWWNSRNPMYYDYSPADCANFVSQCLIAGGLDLSVHPGADSKGCIPSCTNLQDFLVNYVGATYETRLKSQGEPTWFAAGDVAIFPTPKHAAFAVTGDASYDNDATCNAHPYYRRISQDHPMVL